MADPRGAMVQLCFCLYSKTFSLRSTLGATPAPTGTGCVVASDTASGGGNGNLLFVFWWRVYAFLAWQVGEEVQRGGFALISQMPSPGPRRAASIKMQCHVEDHVRSCSAWAAFISAAEFCQRTVCQNGIKRTCRSYCTFNCSTSYSHSERILVSPQSFT